MQVVRWAAAGNAGEDGRSHPVIDVETSSVSHPFYTGARQVRDAAGRIERFHRRYGAEAPAAR